MRIVLDTNILLTSLGKSTNNRWIFDLILRGKLILILSNSIVTEYLEIITNKTTYEIASNVINALLNIQSTEIVNIYYKWNLITSDPDDNKFVDAALSGNADYIISNDNHFNLLKSLSFPKISVLNEAEFKELFI
jgi:putative PIN family toxin of toxin-antitoxin system